MDNPNTSTLPVVFLGGIFTPSQTDFVLKKSKGNIQNAADAFQKNIIRGLTENVAVDVSIVNLPFIGTYPYLFTEPRFPGTREEMFSDVKVVGMPFTLRRFVKAFSRFWGAARGLADVDTRGGSVVLVYSAHLPFIAAALFQKLRKRDTRVCLILPDLPEFMDERGRLYAMVKAVESRLFRLLIKRVDGFIVLTAAMADQLGLETRRFSVVEGIAASPEIPEVEQPIVGKRIFLYTGTLAARYGIVDLIEAFQGVQNEDAELWIAGEGDARDRIIEAAERNSRIRFLGQVSRGEALKLQQAATVLINPRKPTGEFTKYSFPSKTMEYMASGRPVVMFRLPGMPEEYIPHFIDPGTSNPDALQRTIEHLVTAELDELKEFGARARLFVLNQKNAKIQSQKILILMNSIRAPREVYRPTST